jgi:3-oxoacyl-[acyl-carrier-protein] synthase-1
MTTKSNTPASPLFALHSGGVVTAIGNSLNPTAASWLTQVRKMRRIKIADFADPFTIADCEIVTAGKYGAARLSAMLSSAVDEAMGGTASLKLGESGIALEILLLPQWLGKDEADKVSDSLNKSLSPWTQWSASVSERNIIRAGTVGPWLALEYAYRALEQNPNLQYILIAAADSLCEPELLVEAAHADLLLTASNAQGYIPGEAAACILITRTESVRTLAADTFGLHRPKFARSPQRIWPAENQPDATPLAETLSASMQAARLEAQHISHLESDMDGSSWRAQIESAALTRTVFNQTGALPQWRPVNLLGHTGNAGGLIGWLLPALLQGRKIEQVNSVLNWTVDPSGEFAANVLERSPKIPD